MAAVYSERAIYYVICYAEKNEQQLQESVHKAIKRLLDVGLSVEKPLSLFVSFPFDAERKQSAHFFQKSALRGVSIAGFQYVSDAKRVRLYLLLHQLSPNIDTRLSAIHAFDGANLKLSYFCRGITSSLITSQVSINQPSVLHDVEFIIPQIATVYEFKFGLERRYLYVDAVHEKQLCERTLYHYQEHSLGWALRCMECTRVFSLTALPLHGTLCSDKIDLMGLHFSNILAQKSAQCTNQIRNCGILAQTVKHDSGRLPVQSCNVHYHVMQCVSLWVLEGK